jgi:hypothetical protein
MKSFGLAVALEASCSGNKVLNEAAIMVESSNPGIPIKVGGKSSGVAPTGLRRGCEGHLAQAARRCPACASFPHLGSEGRSSGRGAIAVALAGPR